MSQFLLKLEHQLLSVHDPVARAELLARRACSLARLGRFDEARVAVLDLRKYFGEGQSAFATVWIMLTEGLINFYAELDPIALDRISRAQFLSIAMKHHHLIAISSAWRAHLEFETSDFEAMIRSLELVRSNAGPEDHESLTRMSIVLCNAFTFCGDRTQAQVWFLHGRNHALKEGDQASIEAMLYNRATFGLARLRALYFQPQIFTEDISLIRLEINSSQNFQNLTRNTAMSNHIWLWTARLLVLEEKYDLAIEAYTSVRSERPFATNKTSQSVIDLEIAYCNFKLNRNEIALIGYQLFDTVSYQKMHEDERLVAASMRWQMALVDSRFGSSEELKCQLKDAVDVYQKAVVVLASRLAVFH